MNKILVITSGRADYGLLYWVMRNIDASPDYELQIIATGMHLSPEFGSTYQKIEEDGFTINRKVELLLSSDTNEAISKSMGLGMIGFSSAFEELQPDLIVVLGDRFEIFAAVATAMVQKFPIAHIHGGESTEGSIDEAIRHCITKMSHLHFTANEKYSKRVIQLGENPGRVFNVGGPGIENIKKLKLLTKVQLEKAINFKLNIKNILVTFHPVTLENKTSKKQFRELLDTVDELENTNIIFTKANSDIGGKIINHMIDQYVKKNSDKSMCAASLGQLNYLSVLRYVDFMIGNSSSGIHEAPSFKIGTINIGDRQNGRIKSKSVLNCLPNKRSIKKAIKIIYSNKFQKLLKNVKNPYGNGCASKKIVKVLKTAKLDNILRKNFFDIKFSL